MLTHTVMFKLKDRSLENVQKTRDVLMGLKGKIPFLLEIEVGMDVLHSERSYDLVLLSKFATLEDQNNYQVHPAHLEVLKYMKTVVESAASVDFEN